MLDDLKLTANPLMAHNLITGPDELVDVTQNGENGATEVKLRGLKTRQANNKNQITTCFVHKN